MAKNLKEISPEAKRALEEAEARRKAREVEAEAEAPAETESGGPSGQEPTRFGDWERKGIAYDF